MSIRFCKLSDPAICCSKSSFAPPQRTSHEVLVFHDIKVGEQKRGRRASTGGSCQISQSRAERLRSFSPLTGFFMLGWFQALMPKEERFFVLFARHSDAVLAGAKALRAMLDGGSAVQSNYQIVMDREHDADDVTREVLIAVRRTFITPFDRGNISDLITSMDNSIDQMQKTAKSIMLFDLNEFTPQMREMADTVVKCAELLREAVPLLQSLSAEAGHISDLTAKISALEGRADELHDIGLRELYQKNVGGSGLAFYVGNEVYDHLEKVVDRFDDVANVMHGIVIEHV
jgi:predicted phosphate transport protein (TIGR00153 family)